MGKKTEKRLGRCLRRFVEHTTGREAVMEVGGERLDASTFVAGMQAMAAYVGTVLEGEVAPDPDPERMLRVLLSVAWLSRERMREGAEGGDADDE